MMLVMTNLGVLFSLIAFAESSQSFLLDGNSNKLYDFDWQCDTICLGSGGTVRFDLENKICKCTMDKNTDDTDILLMQKNARVMGLQVITNPDHLKLQKREIPESEINQNKEIVGLKKLPKFDFKKFKPAARNSIKLKKFSLDPKKKIEFPTARKSKLIKGDLDTKLRFKEMQDKLKEKLESLTWKLPKIKQRSAFKEASEKYLLDFKNKIEEKKSIKEEKPKFHLNLKNIVGQPSPKMAEGNVEAENLVKNLETPSLQKPSPTNYLNMFEKSQKKHAINEDNKKSHKPEIITQPPGLYDADDSDEEDDLK